MILAAVLAAAPEAVFVNFDDVKIYTDASRSSKVLTTVGEDEELSVIDEVGDFYLVGTADKGEGYIYHGDVSVNPPDDDFGGLMDLLEDGDRTASVPEDSSSHSIRGRTAHMDEDTSSHSIRGLKNSAGANAGLSEEQAESAVSSMEKFSVSSGELQKFQQSGAVGDYAK